VLDDACALAAAEHLLCSFKEPSGDSDAVGDATGDSVLPRCVSDPKEASQKLLVCRRILYALTRVKTRRGGGPGNSGEAMTFFAQELGPAMRAHKAVDLHCVAARLERGLYHLTGDPVQVRFRGAKT